MPRTQVASIGFTSALPWIIVITCLYFLSFFARSILSPLLVPMEIDFSASHGQAAGLMFFLSIGFGVALALAGVVSSRIRHRWVLSMAMGIIGGSLLMLSRAPGIDQARVAFFLFGIGSGLYLPSGMATLASVVDDRFWGRAIAIHELAPNLAFILAPLVVEVTLGSMDWRGCLKSMCIVCCLGGVLFLKFTRGGNEYGTPPNTKTVPLIIRRPAFWAIMVLLGLAVGLEAGPYSIMPLFLVSEKGMSPFAANHMLSTTRLITPLMALTGGWLADRMRISTILAVTLFGSALSLAGMGLLTGTGLSGAIMLQACMPALMFPAVFKSVTEIFGVREQSLVLSLSMPIAYVFAIGLVPTFLGLCGDQGHFDHGFIAVGLLTLMSIAVLPLLKHPKTIKPKALKDPKRIVA
ncbi:MFS transporter [Desulfoluna sp.]|uniref:MFS transporter n=1 Tax=Desulfoluna sp. TaxID=2045199 RepID=UPI002603CBB2|nr:MFS transporter [Desulfoluna sp.]